jgi:hypothetical protein
LVPIRYSQTRELKVVSTLGEQSGGGNCLSRRVKPDITGSRQRQALRKNEVCSVQETPAHARHGRPGPRRQLRRRVRPPLKRPDTPPAGPSAPFTTPRDAPWGHRLPTSTAAARTGSRTSGMGSSTGRGQPAPIRSVAGSSVNTGARAPTPASSGCRSPRKSGRSEVASISSSRAGSSTGRRQPAPMPRWGRSAPRMPSTVQNGTSWGSPPQVRSASRTRVQASSTKTSSTA